jgi:SAM-dependent methyltransferase
MGFDCSEFLSCPSCKSSFEASTSTSSRFQCSGCSKHYAEIGGIPRFVSSESYAASFGFEWNAHKRTQLDNEFRNESEITLKQKTGLSLEEVQGKLVLDAGCGMGRFADVVSRWGAKVVGVDISRAVDAAFENIGKRPNVSIMQADLFALPFRDNSFDIIYSVGVLHHTPDCEGAFRSLVKYLKPGGRIVVWLYDRNIVWGRMAQLYWQVTRRMNPRLLHQLCKLAGPLYHIVKLPGLGKVVWRIFPIDTNPDSEWRVLDTFDWYSARYRSWHTYEEVQKWFEKEGLIQVQFLKVPVSVSGNKPTKPVP